MVNHTDKEVMWGKEVTWLLGQTFVISSCLGVKTEREGLHVDRLHLAGWISTAFPEALKMAISPVWKTHKGKGSKAFI